MPICATNTIGIRKRKWKNWIEYRKFSFIFSQMSMKHWKSRGTSKKLKENWGVQKGTRRLFSVAYVEILSPILATSEMLMFFMKYLY